MTKLYNHKYSRNDRQNDTSKVVSLGMNDEKGRAVGLYVRTFEYATTEDTEDRHPLQLPFPPGRAYVAYMQTTRDGATFGAVQNSDWFATEAARAAAIAKRIESTTKRYAKKYAAK